MKSKLHLIITFLLFLGASLTAQTYLFNTNFSTQEWQDELARLNPGSAVNPNCGNADAYIPAGTGVYGNMNSTDLYFGEWGLYGAIVKDAVQTCPDGHSHASQSNVDVGIRLNQLDIAAVTMPTVPSAGTLIIHIRNNNGSSNTKVGLELNTPSGWVNISEIQLGGWQTYGGHKDTVVVLKINRKDPTQLRIINNVVSSKRFITIYEISLTSFEAPAPPTVADYSVMKTRLFNSVNAPSTGFDLAKCNPDGTFTTVVYPTTYPTDFTGEPRPHLSEMNNMANAFSYSSSPQHKDPALLEAFVKAWDWWYTTNPIDNNWWYRSIGWPNSLIPSFILMSADLETNYPAAYESMKSYLLNEWTPNYYTKMLQETEGANTSDIAYYILSAAIVSKDDNLIFQTTEIFENLIEIETAPLAEGIHADYGFSQHTGKGRQLYIGNYGKEYLGGMIRYLNLTNGTSYQLPAEKITIFENLFLYGVSWIAYRGIFDHHQHGRRVIPSDGYPKTLSCLNQLIALNTPQKAKLQELSSWMSRSFENSAVNIQQGNRIYWRHDYMVHKGENFFTSNRMSSTRVLCSESMNGEGLSNFYTGSGVNYVYVTGQEYLEIWNDLNWRRLPGVTAPQLPRTTPLPLVSPSHVKSLNGSSFAGGTSDGKTGVSGFVYTKKEPNEVDAVAFKSVFYFKDYFVSLGAGVTANTDLGVPVTTTVNQVKFKNQFQVDNNGSVTSVSSGQLLAPTASNKALLNDVGYHFLDNTKLNYEVETQGASDIAWIGINHGNLPSDDSYAYAVHPSITSAELDSRIANQSYVVVANTTQNQCVLDTVAKIAQVMFYQAGRIDLPGNYGFIEVDKAAAVQVRWTNDSVFVDVANPFCESIYVSEIKVTILDEFSGDNVIPDAENSLTEINFLMPADVFQGSTNSLALKKVNDLTGLSDVRNSGSGLKIFPNVLKSGGTFSILTGSQDNKAAKAFIYTQDGLLVREFNVQSAGGKLTLNTNGLLPNLYFVKVNSLNGKIVVY